VQAWAVALTVAFIACGLVGGVLAPDTPNTGFKDAASVLALISLAAVAIERSIEGVFSALASRLGEWWPLRIVRDEFDAFQASTNAVLGPVTTDTLAALTAARAALAEGDPLLDEYDATVARVVAEHDRLAGQLLDVTHKLAPGSARLARLGEINSEMTATLARAQALSATATAEARNALLITRQASERASMIISSFADNPARRVASIVMGASIGMVVAGAMGVNLFAATLNPPDGSAELAGLLAGKVGVLLTGIVIGLGSSPTHEVVKSLQAYKDARNGVEPVRTMLPANTPVATTMVIDEGAGPGGAAPMPGTTVLFRERMVRRSS
jgi:hypothetical protein